MFKEASLLNRILLTSLSLSLSLCGLFLWPNIYPRTPLTPININISNNFNADWPFFFVHLMCKNSTGFVIGTKRTNCQRWKMHSKGNNFTCETVFKSWLKNQPYENKKIDAANRKESEKASCRFLKTWHRF